MKSHIASRSDGKQRVASLGLAVGVALLFLAAMLAGMAPARADGGQLYVDGATGADVDTCGTTGAPCRTISYTINTRAGDGDTLLISAGTYTENVRIDGITLTLQGGYAAGTQWLGNSGETILDGNNAGRTVEVLNSNSVLENLAITNGRTPEEQCWGGGVWVSGGDVTIRSTTITNNSADCSGGGLEVNIDLGPTSLTIEDSVISGNMSSSQGGGLTAWGEVSLDLIRSTVSDNLAANDEQTAGIGGGIAIQNGAAVAVEDSIFQTNSAVQHGGAIDIDGSTLVMTNTLLTGNSAAAINVLALNNSSGVTIRNSTIAANNPQGAQAILAFDPEGSTLEMVNAIMWENALNIQWDGPTGNVAVSYSDIQGGWPGSGNLDADPLFVGVGDFHLQAGSPAIDSGRNDGAPDYDLDGVVRPQDGDNDGVAVVDMGAYELVAAERFVIYLPVVIGE